MIIKLNVKILLKLIKSKSHILIFFLNMHEFIKLTLHLQSFPCPDNLWFGVAFDFPLKQSISSLCKTSIAKNLLEDRRRCTFHIDRHVDDVNEMMVYLASII